MRPVVTDTVNSTAKIEAVARFRPGEARQRNSAALPDEENQGQVRRQEQPAAARLMVGRPEGRETDPIARLR